MTRALELHPDRLFPPEVRTVARRLFAEVEDLPLLCPHGHTDARWFADDERFANPTELLLTRDHYVLRMLYSQGVPLDALAEPPHDLLLARDPLGDLALAPRRRARRQSPSTLRRRRRAHCCRHRSAWRSHTPGSCPGARNGRPRRRR